MISKLEAQQDTQTQSRAARRGMTVSHLVRRSLFYLLITIGAISMLLPFAYMIGIAFTPNAYVLQTPPTFIPVHPTLDNFISAWNDNDFGQAFLNSIIVASSATILSVALASMLAFAFARYQFPGRNVLFYGMLATMTIPAIVLIIPQFVLASRLGLTNTRLGLILVYAAGMAFSVYLLRGFFEELPQELFDAAAIDGCSILRIFFSIALPLARPALAACVIFSFGGNWDEFTWAITSTSDSSLYTLPVAIQQFYSNHLTNWGIVFAASVVAVIPVIIIFIIFQRHFVSGISAGGIKG